MRIDKATKIELIVLCIMLLVSYLLASFIYLDFTWFVYCSKLARGIFLIAWAASSLGVIYSIETN